MGYYIASCGPLGDYGMTFLPAGFCFRLVTSSLFFLGPVLFLTGLLLLLFPGYAKGFVADRIIAVVSKEVIALSDVKEYETLFPAKPGEDQATGLNRLVEQKILVAEARRLEILPPTEEELVVAYQNLENRHGGPEDFQKIKTAMNLSDEEIRYYLRARLHVDKFIDQRIRFFVFATPREVEAFRKKFPEYYAHLQEEERLQAIQGAIIEKKAAAKLATYLARLRARADIQVNFPR